MTVVAVGPLPPPLHGAARVTSAAVELLRRAGVGVAMYDTGVQHTGARYHLARVAAHGKAAVRVAFGRRVHAVYIGGAGGAGLWYQLVVAAAARLRGVPVVFHHHSSQYLNKRNAAMGLLCAVGRRGTTHVTLTASMSRGLRAGYPRAERVVQLSNAAFLDVADALPIVTRRGVPIVGQVSNLSRAKGLVEVLDTFTQLRERGTDVELRLAGPVADAEDRRLIEAAIARDPARVTYAGPLSPSEVPAFLAGLDLFLFPSRYRHEAEPLVVLEAAREGVPTLAYPVGGLPEVLAATGGTVVPVDSSFADAVQVAITELLAARPGEVRHRVHGEMKGFRTGQAEALSTLLALLT